jgi:glutamine synthetase
MLCNTKEEVLKTVKDQDVSFIQFWFTDVLGILKSFAVTPSELEEGMGFDGSSMETRYEGDPRYVLTNAPETNKNSIAAGQHATCQQQSILS